MSSLTDMDLFDDINDGGGLEPQQLSDDDLPSDEDDDEDDDDDELDTTDIGHVRFYCDFLFLFINKLF
jgi:hypothetical protein